MRNIWVRIAIGAALVFAIACGGEEKREQPANQPPAVGTATVAASPTPSVDDGTRGPGTYEVGTGIAAGKWETTAPADAGCYWSRNRDASGSFDSIIANGNVEKGTPGIVQIAKTDKYVNFEGTCRWRKTA
jgi:hypothetical protein